MKIIMMISVVAVLLIASVGLVIAVPEDKGPPFVTDEELDLEINSLYDYINSAIDEVYGYIDSFFDVFVKIDDTTNWDKNVHDDITECDCPITQEEYDDIIARLEGLEGGIAGCTINSDCLSNEYCAKTIGSCNDIGECLVKPTVCPDVYAPICSCDDQNYDNECQAAMAGVNMDYSGECQACTPSEEICDYADNDCDGLIDENWLDLGDACGVGACADGIMECSVDGTTTICSTDGTGSDEICDGFDNDCDGEVDEGDVCSMEGEPCDDGNMCTTGETWTLGVCGGGSLTVCNDNNVCTDDVCNSLAGCNYVANTNSCDDGNMCTEMDMCSGGACVGGTPTVCDDDNVCTDDVCNPLIGCSYIANMIPCDDGFFCNGLETCFAGICSNPGTPPCSGPDGDYDCAESCDEISDDCNLADPNGAFCSLNDSNGECSEGMCYLF